MKKIQQKQNKFQNSEANKTIARINRLRVAFEQIEAGDQTKFIELLAVEIEVVEDETVKLWLIKFRSILEAVREGATNV